jgi:hypothetical protein
MFSLEKRRSYKIVTIQQLIESDFNTKVRPLL